MPRHRKADLVGRWELIELLGQGGNAEVWRATDGDSEVALKILNQSRVDSEPYQRFRQEIQALQQIGSHPSILPLLDAHLPEGRSRGSLAWLAMPIAMPLREALKESTLREVVVAVTVIARTLAELGEQFDIHHRDIKPSNLYLLEDRPALSDFGVADIPEADDLTVASKPLGPKHFLPYEMIDDPKNADPAPADVYSLAKTLWVLCVDHRWPPQGEQHAENNAYSIAALRPYPLARSLDELIERCTQHEPGKRPSMRQACDDLQAWLALDKNTPQQSVDLSETWGKLRAAAEPRLRQVSDEAAQQQCFRQTVQRLQELLDPLHTEIRREFSAVKFNQQLKIVESFFFEHPKYETTNEDIRATVLSGPDWNPVLLVIGVAVRTKTNGDVKLGGLYYLGRIETMGGQIDRWQSERQRVPCDSILLEASIAQLAGEIRAMFPSWLEKFNAALESEER